MLERIYRVGSCIKYFGGGFQEAGLLCGLDAVKEMKVILMGILVILT